MTTNLDLFKNGTENKMSSREISELTGREHKNVLQSIRSMHDAWVKITGMKFQISKYTDSTGRKLPEYRLNKIECLYIATKFSNEARAKLVLRWGELETDNNRAKEMIKSSSFDKEDAPITTYIVQDAGNSLYKIGKTTDICRRFKEITSLNPKSKIVYLIDGDHELSLHKLYRELNYVGEWFNLSDNNLESIKQIFNDDI